MQKKKKVTMQTTYEESIYYLLVGDTKYGHTLRF